MEHGILIKKEIKKDFFEREQYAEKYFDIAFKNIEYKANENTLSVYGFNKDIMLILKARLFKLKELVFHKLEQNRH